MLTLFGHRAPEIVLNYIRQCVADNIRDYVVSNAVRIVNLGLINVFYPEDVSKIVPKEVYKELLPKWGENKELKSVVSTREKLLNQHKTLTDKVKQLPKRANCDELVQKIMSMLKVINDLYDKCKKLRQRITKGIAKCLKKIREGDKTIDNTLVMIGILNESFEQYEKLLKHARSLAKKCSMELFGILHQVNKDEVSARLESAKKRLYHPFKSVSVELKVNDSEEFDLNKTAQEHLEKVTRLIDEFETATNEKVKFLDESKQAVFTNYILDTRKCIEMFSEDISRDGEFLKPDKNNDVGNHLKGYNWCSQVTEYLEKSGAFMDELAKTIDSFSNKNDGSETLFDPSMLDMGTFDSYISEAKGIISNELNSKVQQTSNSTPAPIASDALQSVKTTVKKIISVLDSIDQDQATKGIVSNVQVLGAVQEVYKSIYKVFDAMDTTVQNLLRTKELTADTISMVFYGVSVVFASLAVIGGLPGVVLFAALPLVKMITSVVSVASTVGAIGYKYWHNYGAPAWVSNIVSKVKNRLSR